MVFTLIGRYEFVKEIGQGGFGAVEQYRDVLTDENVAIKTIPAVYVNQESKRLVREVDIMRFLHTCHPHIIGCFYMFATPAVNAGGKKSWHNSVPPTPPEMDLQSPAYQHMRLFDKLSRHHALLTESVEKLRSSGEFNVHIVMPLMSGDLFYIIKLINNPSRAKDIITPEYLGTVAAIYAFQICFGLDFLHKCGIVHRDVKPDNVLVNLNTKAPFMSSALIADLGLARDTANSETFYVCTRYYRPPDVVMGFSKGASATDIWSVGCVLYELCTCQTLFTVNSALNERGTWDGYYASQQLEVILNIMGCPTPEDVQRYAPESTNAKSYLLRSTPRPSQLEALLRKNWRLAVDEPTKARWIDLIKSCLRFFPQQRPTAEQLCQHPLFSEIGMLFGDNVKQVRPEKYQPLYDEKHLCNQNRAENKHTTLGLIGKALDDTTPEQQQVTNQEMTELEQVEESAVQDESRHRQNTDEEAGASSGKKYHRDQYDDDEDEDAEDCSPSQVAGVSAYSVKRGSDALAGDADDAENGEMSSVAPSIYNAAASATQHDSMRRLADEEQAGSLFTTRSGMPSMFDQNTARRAVVENEESEDVDDEPASSSDSDEDGSGPRRVKGPCTYPSVFLRHSQDPPQPPQQPTAHHQQGSLYMSRDTTADALASSDVGGDGGSFLGHYVIPSMFRQPDTNAASGRQKGREDTDGLEPATLLRRTVTGSGDVHAPYNYLSSMRMPAGTDEDTREKVRTAGVSLLPAVKQSTLSPQSMSCVRSDLQDPYPLLIDAYTSATADAGKQSLPAPAKGTSATEHTRPTKKQHVAEQSRKTARTGTHKPDAQGGASSPARRSSGTTSQSKSETIGVPPPKLLNETTGWAMEGPQFEKAKVPAPHAATTTDGTHLIAANKTQSDLAADYGAYNYFDSVLLNTYADGRSFLQTALPQASAPTLAASSSNVYNHSHSLKYPGAASDTAEPGYSLLQRRVSEDNAEKVADERETSRGRAGASQDFPSLSDRSLEERYREFTRSDSDMQRGMTAVLAELNHSTDDPEKTQQLRDVMNFFGRHLQSRK